MERSILFLRGPCLIIREENKRLKFALGGRTPKQAPTKGYISGIIGARIAPCCPEFGSNISQHVRARSRCHCLSFVLGVRHVNASVKLRQITDCRLAEITAQTPIYCTEYGLELSSPQLTVKKRPNLQANQARFKNKYVISLLYAPFKFGEVSSGLEKKVSYAT